MRGSPVITMALALLAGAGCKTVHGEGAADGTPPAVKLDLYGVDEPDAALISFADCCAIRRAGSPRSTRSAARLRARSACGSPTRAGSRP